MGFRHVFFTVGILQESTALEDMPLDIRAAVKALGADVLDSVDAGGCPDTALKFSSSQR
jgi:hypothetical protein